MLQRVSASLRHDALFHQHTTCMLYNTGRRVLLFPHLLFFQWIFFNYLYKNIPKVLLIFIFYFLNSNWLRELHRAKHNSGLHLSHTIELIHELFWGVVFSSHSWNVVAPLKHSWISWGHQWNADTIEIVFFLFWLTLLKRNWTALIHYWFIFFSPLTWLVFAHYWSY